MSAATGPNPRHSFSGTDGELAFSPSPPPAHTRSHTRTAAAPTPAIARPVRRAARRRRRARTGTCARVARGTGARSRAGAATSPRRRRTRMPRAPRARSWAAARRGRARSSRSARRACTKRRGRERAFRASPRYLPVDEWPQLQLAPCALFFLLFYLYQVFSLARHRRIRRPPMCPLLFSAPPAPRQAGGAVLSCLFLAAARSDACYIHYICVVPSAIVLFFLCPCPRARLELSHPYIYTHIYIHATNQPPTLGPAARPALSPLSIASLSSSSSCLRSLPPYLPTTHFFISISQSPLPAPKRTTCHDPRAAANAKLSRPPPYVRARARHYYSYVIFFLLPSPCTYRPPVVCHNHVLFIPSQFNYGSVCSSFGVPRV